MDDLYERKDLRIKTKNSCVNRGKTPFELVAALLAFVDVRAELILKHRI